MTQYLWLTAFVLKFCLLRCGFAAVSFQSGDVVFSCSSASTPIWVMQSGNDPIMRGIAMGDRKQPTFKDPRSVVADIHSQVNALISPRRIKSLKYSGPLIYDSLSYSREIVAR